MNATNTDTNPSPLDGVLIWLDSLYSTMPGTNTVTNEKWPVAQRAIVAIKAVLAAAPGTREAIELAAEAIYNLMPYDEQAIKDKPAWAPGGNSFKQDDARRYACAALGMIRPAKVPDGAYIELTDTPYGRSYTNSLPPMEMPVGRYWFGPAPRPDVQAVGEDCIWQQEGRDGEGAWTTGCENMFTLEADTPSENNMAFCCYCGKPLVELFFIEEAAE